MSQDVRSLLLQTDQTVPKPGARPMSFEERRKLSQKIAALTPDKVQPVVDIISANHTLRSDENEVELDMDLLSEATCWALEEYCQVR